ncbi:Yip1 family protein [Sphingomonas sp. SUN039]|uniref:Yip1 family protein n=1 Tax=Sphingomonas sp. SUN039 TaxID=2937787 RepID=UPI0021643410|nr:Yip1 family protein [Sphingomonas sp. SUN039]UVO52745.1 YIP1 family protein [Sphingomonas sp. SUN039]
MSDLGPGPAGNSLIGRVKNILLTPKTEWPRIDAEPSTIADIYKSHVIPLAAIGPVASLIGGQMFGHGAFGIVYRPTLLSSIVTALVGYALTLVMVYVMALVIEALAPQFGGTKNRLSAFKVAAYGATASWVAGIFGLMPMLGLLGIIGGLYSLYLIYLGLPVLMKAPEDKAVGYTAVVVLCLVVASLAVGLITAPVALLFGGGGLVSSAGTVSGTVNMPGGGSLDMGKLDEATKKMEAAAERMKSGQAAPAIAPDVLQGLLPATLNGLARTSIESQSGGAAGIAGSNAEARYGSGDSEIKLSVTDMGAMGGLAALGGALNVQSSKQEGTSYEKVGKVDGRMTTEKFDTADKRGSYGTIVGDRVMVQAEGHAASIDVLKAAVAGVDLAKVEGLARE